MSEQALLNCQELGASIGRCPNYIVAMKRAGYPMKHPSLGRTTREHALAWLDHNPGFRAHEWLKKGWERFPKLPAAPTSQPV